MEHLEDFEKLIEDICGPKPSDDASTQTKIYWYEKRNRVRFEWMKNAIEKTEIGKILSERERAKMIQFLEQRISLETLQCSTFNCDCGAEYSVYMRPIDLDDYAINGRLPYDRMWSPYPMMMESKNIQTSFRCMFCDRWFAVRGGRVKHIEIERIGGMK